MRNAYVPTFLLAALTASAAASGAETHLSFVKGHTTVAEAEQSLGAPMDTTMAPDGALTLVYPAARLAERAPGALGQPPRAHTVALRFATDFTYQDAVQHPARPAHTGLAAR